MSQNENDTAPSERELEAQATRELTELQSKALMASDMQLEREVMSGAAPTQEHFAAVTRLNNWRSQRGGRTQPAASDGEEREPDVVRTPHKQTAPAREEARQPRRAADDKPRDQSEYLRRVSKFDMSDPDEREEAKKLRRWAVREHREWIDG